MRQLLRPDILVVTCWREIRLLVHRLRNARGEFGWSGVHSKE